MMVEWISAMISASSSSWDFSPSVATSRENESFITTGELKIPYVAIPFQLTDIFEKNQQHYNLYVSKYKNEAEIGNTSPEILEILVINYDKSNAEHRVALRRYLG